MRHVFILSNGMVLIRDGDRVLYIRKGIIQYDGPWKELPKPAKKALVKDMEHPCFMRDKDGPFELWY